MALALDAAQRSQALPQNLPHPALLPAPLWQLRAEVPKENRQKFSAEEITAQKKQAVQSLREAIDQIARYVPNLTEQEIGALKELAKNEQLLAAVDLYAVKTNLESIKDKIYDILMRIKKVDLHNARERMPKGCEAATLLGAAIYSMAQWSSYNYPECARDKSVWLELINHNAYKYDRFTLGMDHIELMKPIIDREFVLQVADIDPACAADIYKRSGLHTKEGWEEIIQASPALQAHVHDMFKRAEKLVGGSAYFPDSM